MAERTPLRLVFSYSHKDEALRDELAVHFSVLSRQGVIDEWHDRRIVPGGVWAEEIDQHFESADIILLLVSADFIASDYCYEKEMTRALQRHDAGETRVIPVMLRPCDRTGTPFEHLQGLPRDMRPITTWANRDEALADVTRGIRQVAELLR